jgi:hypothetical protein
VNDEILQPVTDASLISPTFSGRSTKTEEKLIDMFNATDMIRVINPDDEAYIWQYMNPAKERIEFDTSSSTVPQKIVYREPPDVYKLEPGQSAAIVGANGYVMIDGLVKKLMSKNAISRTPNVKPGEARNFNFSDDAAQIRWINEIYLGKVTMTTAPITPPRSQAPDLSEIDKDLGVDDDFTAAVRKRRPRQAKA